MGHECFRGGQKHCFEPRYNVLPPTDEVIKHLASQYTGSAVTNQIAESSLRMYICDGKVTNRRD